MLLAGSGDSGAGKVEESPGNSSSGLAALFSPEGMSEMDHKDLSLQCVATRLKLPPRPPFFTRISLKGTTLELDPMLSSQ